MNAELQRLRRHLRRLEALRGGSAEERRGGLRVAEWQVARLRRTHADLLRNPRSGPPIAFFFDRLYSGGSDMADRERELERLAPVIARILPATGVQTLVLALEMNALTAELDIALWSALEDGVRRGAEEIDELTYLEALRRCDDGPQRSRQIDLLAAVGADLDRAVHDPRIVFGLKLAGPPARLAGLGELHALLYEGSQSFRGARGASGFMRTIIGRERRILERMLAGEDDPFDFV